MNRDFEFEDIFTYRGLQLLRRLGNKNPSYSQIELTQSIVSMLGENPENCKKLDHLLTKEGQSYEVDTHILKLVGVHELSPTGD